VPPEADVKVDYEEISRAFADGSSYTLRKPHYRLETLGYGAPSSGLQMSPRVAPQLIGLGLLEGVAPETLEKLADPQDRDHDGISGRLNQVMDHAKQALAIGRFGWKAEQPTVTQQIAGAFLGDMGLTSGLFSDDGCGQGQDACRAAPNGGVPEVEPHVLDAITVYACSLAVPARRDLDVPSVKRGEGLFETLGCARCHVPTLRSLPLALLPELTEQDIHPYTDLLLHDMGEGLSDERPSFEAEGREWRTPPLWGIGLVSKVNEHTFFLHDGRARNLGEAIVWHDGEARASREDFERLPRSDRESLIAFLESL
jgi:CxxC motif-containing protein (DUF1111 family)